MATTASAPARDAALVASLDARNATFTTLLGLIPSRYYVAPTEEEIDSRYMKKKKRKTGDEIKEHKKRAKQEKLDPSNLPSATDASAPTDAPTSAALPPALPALSALPPAASIADLRDRMRSKLDSFRKDRGADDDPESRDALEHARRQKRGEMRDRRRRERKEERRKARVEVTAKTAKTQLIVPNLPKEDSISFPAINLPSTSKKQNAPLKKLSNPSQALAHLEKHNAKLASLPEDKRKEIEDRERWAKAEERAAGGKVADQETVLKKAVKREEKRKSKSGKEWNDRKKKIEFAAAAAAKKRNDNIASRIDSRRNKKSGSKGKDKGKDSKKKGRPGFEGKNKDKKKRAAARA